jgi:hypothetical protein
MIRFLVRGQRTSVSRFGVRGGEEERSKSWLDAALAIDVDSAASVSVTSRGGVLGTPARQPFAPSWMTYGITYNAASETTHPSHEETPTERQRRIRFSQFISLLLPTLFSSEPQRSQGREEERKPHS